MAQKGDEKEFMRRKILEIKLEEENMNSETIDRPSREINILEKGCVKKWGEKGDE